MCKPRVRRVFDVLHGIPAPGSQNARMQVCPIGETELTRCAGFWREWRAGALPESRHFHYDERLYRYEEHEVLGFVLGLAADERNIVVCNLTYATAVHASRDGLDMDKLTFVPTK